MNWDVVSWSLLGASSALSEGMKTLLAKQLKVSEWMQKPNHRALSLLPARQTDEVLSDPAVMGQKVYQEMGET